MGEVFSVRVSVKKPLSSAERAELKSAIQDVLDEVNKSTGFVEGNNNIGLDVKVS